MTKYNNILLVSDLDRTLLDDDHKISNVNKKAIEDFISKGGMFTLATGRVKDSAYKYAKELDLDLPIILNNGGVIYDMEKESFIWQRELESYKDDLEEIIQLSKDQPILIHIYQDGHSYYIGPEEMIKESDYKEGLKSTPIDQADFSKPISKIMIISDQLELLKEIEDLVKGKEENYNTVYSQNNYFEVLPDQVDKGLALDFLIEEIEERKDQEITAVAIGDNINDLNMLKRADYGFYVENSHEALKIQELRPTISNMDNAVAYIIENFIYKNL